MWQAVAGSMLGAISARNTNRRAIAYSRELAQNQHQWAVEDMRKAGLNPLLSATSGMSSQGHMPDLKNPMSAGEGAALGRDVAAGIAKIKAETDNINVDTGNKKKQSILLDLESLLKQEQIGQTVADTLLKYSQSINVEMDTALKQATSARTRADTAKIINETEALMHRLHGLKVEGEIDQSEYGQALRYIDRSLRTVQTVGGMIGLQGILSKIQSVLSKQMDAPKIPKGIPRSPEKGTRNLLNRPKAKFD